MDEGCNVGCCGAQKAALPYSRERLQSPQESRSRRASLTRPFRLSRKQASTRLVQRVTKIPTVFIACENALHSIYARSAFPRFAAGPHQVCHADFIAHQNIAGSGKTKPKVPVFCGRQIFCKTSGAQKRVTAGDDRGGAHKIASQEYGLGQRKRGVFSFAWRTE